MYIYIVLHTLVCMLYTYMCAFHCILFVYFLRNFTRLYYPIVPFDRFRTARVQINRQRKNCNVETGAPCLLMLSLEVDIYCGAVAQMTTAAIARVYDNRNRIYIFSSP